MKKTVLGITQRLINKNKLAKLVYKIFFIFIYVFKYLFLSDHPVIFPFNIQHTTFACCVDFSLKTELKASASICQTFIELTTTY